MATKVERRRAEEPSGGHFEASTTSPLKNSVETIIEEEPKVDIYFSLNKKIELRSSSIAGVGMYAKEPIAKGEVIWYDPDYPRTKHIVDVATIHSWTEEKRDWFLHWAYQVDDTHFCGPLTDEAVALDASLFQNHCCDPTTWFNGEYCMTARRDIAVDEEITFDYAMTETYYDWSTFNCGCGSPHCRGTITGNDYLLPEIQKKYEGHFLPYIQEKIKKLPPWKYYHQVLS